MPRPGFGMEGFMGIGGGTVSKESEANLKRGQDLLNKKKPDEALPFLLKAMEDPNNLDACNSVSMMLPPNMVIEFLKNTELKGHAHLQRVLGPDCFELTCEYGAPNFWGILETRPYMRLLGTLPADALYFTQQWLECDETPSGSGIDFAPPRRTAMMDMQYQNVAKWTDLQMIYSAALAAFTLNSDCELARQYLHIAVQFLTVLIKVLGKFKERVDVDTHPTREHNGAEDTRDHLWLVQDLWMQDNVWNWVDKDQVMKDRVLRECGNPTCKQKEERVGQWQKCAGCKKYCSRNCQKVDWQNNKEACKKEQSFAHMMW
ncbi:hypothetical protein B0H10DRAFT_1951098 [Mycena sp. CBHHK59/15]|nr:hypothetical protein B0H10DRAFT_1951098 [Mycena sp. CBHHK59/15]